MIGFYSSATIEERGTDGNTFISFGGSSRQRVLLPARELERHGFDVQVAPYLRWETDDHVFLTPTADPEVWMAPDLMVLHSWFAPDLVRDAVAAGQRVVLDLDDDYPSIPSSHGSFESLSMDDYEGALQACTAITVSTQRIYELVAKYDKPTYLLRNAVDLSQWEGVAENRLTLDTTRYAWVGDVRFRADDLSVLRKAGFWPWILAHDDAVACHLGDTSDIDGSPSFRRKMSIPLWECRGKLFVSPLVHISQYASAFTSIDVVVIPLEDHPLNHAKSWLRGLECCAAGVPFIASAGFDEYDELWAEGAFFWRARTAQEWREGLDHWRDPDVREAVAEVNRKVAELWDIASCWPSWADVYDEVLDGMLR